MADAMQELESAIKLIHMGSAELRAKDPNHELLRFSETFDQQVVPEEFQNRFGGEHIPLVHRDTQFARAAMYANYYDAMVKALGN